MKMRPLIDTFKKSNIVLPSILAAFILLLLGGCGGDAPVNHENPTTIKDIDGNTYRTVKIGNQWWMAENLRVTHYRNGDPIPNLTDSTTWTRSNIGAYCSYDNDSNYGATYGSLYNEYAVNDNRNIAPEGWHVPSDAEWQTLIHYLGGRAIAGGKMKETGTTHWLNPNTGATNQSGFSALPGGIRFYGDYVLIGARAIFWSSTTCNDDCARYGSLDYSHSSIIQYYRNQGDGFSVRCVMD